MHAFVDKLRMLGSVPVLLGFALLALLPLGLTSNPYQVQTLMMSMLFAFYVMSWDVLSGTTNEINFGHPFWLLMAGFTAAWLSIHLELNSVLTVSAGALVALVLGLAAGWLTLRMKGPYFALLTLALSASLYKISFIWSDVFGGEEGLSGVGFLSATAQSDYYIVLVLLAVSYVLLYRYYRSRFGLVLMGIKANEDVTQASGHNVAAYRIVTFGIAMFFAGVAGALTAHVQGSINAGMAGGVVGTLVVLYAMIGSRGTLGGPLVAGFILYYLNENLPISETWRPLVFLIVLIVAIYLFPDGVVRAVRERVSGRRRARPKQGKALSDARGRQPE